MGNRLITYLCLWAGPGGTEGGPLLLALSACVRVSLAMVIQAMRVLRPVKTMSEDTRRMLLGTWSWEELLCGVPYICVSGTRERLGLC